MSDSQPGRGLVFGADYNPEQWPADVRADDVRLMREAGVNLVAVGIFSWGLLEPEPDRFDFGWLDDVLDDLHTGGIGVCLATATATAPAWLSADRPEVLPLDADGRRLAFGSRQTWCPSSPVFRDRSLRIVEQLATRYADHPALTSWHVSNELGGQCYCEVSAASFRRWLSERYGDVEALNTAWSTTFWSQHYTSFEQVQVPAHTRTLQNPTQLVDFARFSSDELLGQFLAEKEVLRRLTPDVPVTTNFMVGAQLNPQQDYGRWAREQDVVSNDHYLVHGEYDDPRAELAYSADLTRGVADGQPWLLMEHSTSAVNWQPVNIAKGAGQMLQDSLSHVARGADGICFFQWRAAAGGAEQWHSAMVPHAGEDTERFREVVELGAVLGRLGELRGSTVRNDVALLVDWQNAWAMTSGTPPSQRIRHHDLALRVHGLLRAAQTGADVVPVTAHDGPGTTDLADVLSGYRVLVVPTLYLCDDTTAAAVRAAAASGTHVLVTYLSGIVDGDLRVRLGGYPGAFRDLLGIRVEEFHPLADGVACELDDGTVGDLWAEIATAYDDTEVLARYAEGATAGCPALTRRDLPSGATAWYLGTWPDDEALAGLLRTVCAGAGVEPVADASGPVDVVRRRAADGRSWLFALNHGEEPATVRVDGFDLVTESAVAGVLDLDPGASAVVREG